MGSSLDSPPNQEIVSFRSCVRCEAACARGTMLLPRLGGGTSKSPPVCGLACPWFSSSFGFVNSLPRERKRVEGNERKRLEAVRQCSVGFLPFGPRFCSSRWAPRCLWSRWAPGACGPAGLPLGPWCQWSRWAPALCGSM